MRYHAMICYDYLSQQLKALHEGDNSGFNYLRRLKREGDVIFKPEKRLKTESHALVSLRGASLLCRHWGCLKMARFSIVVAPNHRFVAYHEVFGNVDHCLEAASGDQQHLRRGFVTLNHGLVAYHEAFGDVDQCLQAASEDRQHMRSSPCQKDMSVQRTEFQIVLSCSQSGATISRKSCW